MSFVPLSDTFGVRIEKLLHTANDYHKYHGYLNLKLQKLRRNLQLITNDTKKYALREKYSKLDKVAYNDDKRVGLLVLLHAERDLAFVEMLKLNARERGHWKKSEKKQTATRLKSVSKTASKLLKLSEDESSWVIRAELLIFSKLSTVEYLLNGKQTREDNSRMISKELALVASSLEYLRAEKCLSSEIVNHITFRYEHFLRQTSNKYSSRELREFILTQVESSGSDELLVLLKKQGFGADRPSKSDEMPSAPTTVNWRRFAAEIHSTKVGQLLQEIESSDEAALKKLEALLPSLSKQVIDRPVYETYETNVSKWNEVLQAQEVFMENSQEIDVIDGEDDQILLTYLKFRYTNALVMRELFSYHYYFSLSGFFSMTRFAGHGCEKMKGVVSRLVAYLQDMIELPGVYSDDELMFQLEIAKTFYQTSVTLAIGSLYFLRMNYTEALAIFNHCMNIIKSTKDAVGDVQLDIVPHIIDRKLLEMFEDIVREKLKVVGETLAEIKCGERSPRKKDMSLVEILDSGRPFGPWDVSIDNLFPHRPQIKPISAKPTLFDLAFNYIRYDDIPALSEKVSEDTSIDEPEPAKKRGIFGLFGR